MAIRDHVNKPWKHYLLRQKKSVFSQLCSAMDMIEDTDNAILAFETGQFPQDKPGLYLAICGLLQALVVQQDAVYHLSEALDCDLNMSDFPDLAEVREIRHHSFGHPTKKNRPKSAGVSYNHIIQISMSHQGFELLSFMEDGTTKHRYVNLHKVISSQTQTLTTILYKILISLEEEEKQHKEHFREEKLAPLFHSSIHYHCDKVVEAAYQDDEPEFGLINLNIVLDAANQFREAIARRNMDFHESLEHEYNLLHHAGNALTGFFKSRAEHIDTSIDKLSAEIFAKHIHMQIQNLIEYAKDIDQDYEK